MSESESESDLFDTLIRVNSNLIIIMPLLHYQWSNAGQYEKIDTMPQQNTANIKSYFFVYCNLTRDLNYDKLEMI